MGSYYNGIYTITNPANEVKHWNKNNSILQAVTKDSTRTRIAGLTFDKMKIGFPVADTKTFGCQNKDNTWHNWCCLAMPI
ncbi:MAG: hypothetical protein IPJ39_19240 [Saprospiraceae bacterium]|nr:hypothetical protein [Saprospiraceae bacterium]